MLQTKNKSMSQPETGIMLKSCLKPELDDFMQAIYGLPPKEQQSVHQFLQGMKFMMNISRGFKVRGSDVREGEQQR